MSAFMSIALTRSECPEVSSTYPPTPYIATSCAPKCLVQVFRVAPSVVAVENERATEVEAFRCHRKFNARIIIFIIPATGCE